MFIEKLINGDIFSINLVEDLTLSGNVGLMDEVKESVARIRTLGAPLPSMYSNYVNYCVRLLNNNKVEVYNSIKQIY